jgi:hypothetical protein
MRFGGIWKAGLGAAKPDPEIAARIKLWTRQSLGLNDDATISETVILVMIPGQRTKAYKVQAAMAEVSEEMVRIAVC